ncbi:MAG: NAD(P)/FAD-dependent oxidoreductase [Desulfobacterales bacterium]|nr:NAD(P)/FAD-dependent oxidoreductase [Desulfobacterales bacterium]
MHRRPKSIGAMANTHFPLLFQPIRIGRLESKNRLLMSAMSIHFGVDERGHVTEQLTRYMEARAQGGVGMMLVGGGGVHPTGVELPHLPALWEDDCIPSLTKMAQAVKPHDTLLGMQLMHGGRQSYHDLKVAPSAIPAPALAKGIPRALRLDEIPVMAAAFGDAARRCRDAGLDFIEVHGAHGYLISQFLAPNSNRRNDRYGGSFENRTRFMLEVLEDIRRKCGPDFTVGIRMNGEDYIEGGWGLEEALRLAPLLEQAGADYLHVSAGVYGSRQLTIPSMYVEHGCFIHLAEAVKRTVAIPVVAVGRIKRPEMAEGILRDRKADMVALGRSLLADPQWPNKVKHGSLRSIRPCIGCCLGCIHAVFQLEPGGCVVNPDVGREYLLPQAVEPAAAPRRCLVVGSGPAGLAAARMLALRGHAVTLCDQQAETGGALRLAAKPPGRSELMDILNYFAAELAGLAVDLRLNCAVTAELLQEVDPEEVILATGSLPDTPMIKGLLRTGMQVGTVTEVLAGVQAAGAHVLVWGGNQAALVLADDLAAKGKNVVVLNRRDHFAEDMSSNDRYYLRERLKRGGIVLHKNVQIHSFLEDGVDFSSSGRRQELRGFDTVVLADTFVSLREAANLTKGRPARVHFIGDAKQPRHLMYAISEGEELGRAL